MNGDGVIDALRHRRCAGTSHDVGDFFLTQGVVALEWPTSVGRWAVVAIGHEPFVELPSPMKMSANLALVHCLEIDLGELGEAANQRAKHIERGVHVDVCCVQFAGRHHAVVLGEVAEAALTRPVAV
mgnify:FL=1